MPVYEAPRREITVGPKAAWILLGKDSYLYGYEGDDPGCLPFGVQGCYVPLRDCAPVRHICPRHDALIRRRDASL